MTEVAAVGWLEPVDEHRKRRAIVELETPHLERHPGDVRELGRPARAADPLHAAVQGRERAADALDLPDPVELTHRPVGSTRCPGQTRRFRRWRRSWSRRCPPAWGGRSAGSG